MPAISRSYSICKTVRRLLGTRRPDPGGPGGRVEAAVGWRRSEGSESGVVAKRRAITFFPGAPQVRLGDSWGSVRFNQGSGWHLNLAREPFHLPRKPGLRAERATALAGAINILKGSWHYDTRLVCGMFSHGGAVVYGQGCFSVFSFKCIKKNLKCWKKYHSYTQEHKLSHVNRQLQEFDLIWFNSIWPEVSSCSRSLPQFFYTYVVYDFLGFHSENGILIRIFNFSLNVLDFSFVSGVS